MEDSRKETGRRGEQLACDYLENKGHRIVARNWRASHKEVDIISLSPGGVLHIVEVKTRTEPVAAPPELNVDNKKMNTLTAAAGAFLRSAGVANVEEVVFDVVSVVFSDTAEPRVEYFPQAYIPTYA